MGECRVRGWRSRKYVIGLDSFMSFAGIFVSAAFAIVGIIIAFKYF